MKSLLHQQVIHVHLVHTEKTCDNYSGSILFDVGELHQHLFCIKKYRKDTLKSFRINLATNS